MMTLKGYAPSFGHKCLTRGTKINIGQKDLTLLTLVIRGDTSLNIMVLSIMALSIMVLNIMVLSMPRKNANLYN
jgi:hypothetical protein